MEEIIKILQNEEGGQVISARELYQFLEVRADFTTWCKRMFEYGFIENQDYSLLTNIGEQKRGGHNKADYALTLDTAKEISMIQRSEKGRIARKYFIECERQANELLHTNRELLKLCKSMENRIARLEVGGSNNESNMLLIGSAPDPMVRETKRASIRRIINQYCHKYNADYRSVWNTVYERLFYSYGINLRVVVRRKNENILDAAERLGHIDKIYSIVSTILT